MHDKQVMTPNVSVVGPATAISEIARKMRDEDIGVTLVVERNRLIGVVTGGEIVTRVVAGHRASRSAAAREAASQRLQYWSFHDVLAKTGANRVRRLPA